MRYIVFIDQAYDDDDAEIDNELRGILNDLEDVDVESHPLVSSINDTNNAFVMDDEQFDRLRGALRARNIQHVAYRLID